MESRVFDRFVFFFVFVFVPQDDGTFSRGLFVFIFLLFINSVCAAVAAANNYF